MPDAVIIGAGMAGISAAYFLARAGLRDLLLVDERPPLSLTSSRSTECYRNWWPQPEMAALMNRSIDLMESLALESGNRFGMNRRGYLFLTANPDRVPGLIAEAESTARAVGQDLRVHRGQSGDPTYQPATVDGWQESQIGADLLLDPALIHLHFPGLNQKVRAALHVRRAGWLRADELGGYLLEKARADGVRLIEDRVIGIEVANGRVQAIRLQKGGRMTVPVVVNAAGPYLHEVANMAGMDLPVHTELHLKVAFRDDLGVIDRKAPLLIWTEPGHLPWTQAERDLLTEDPDSAWLLGEFPAGAHARPEGGADSPMALLLWEYAARVMPPVWPPPLDETYPEIVLRGLSAMLPGLQRYFGNAPRPVLDGGYYTKTAENLPLIGPTPIEGLFLIGALSGYGIMSACAAGELLTLQLTGAPLPAHADFFCLSRYADPALLERLATAGPSGQL